MKANKAIDLKSKGYYSLTILDKKGNRVEEKCVNNSPNVITYEGAYNQLSGNNQGIFDGLVARAGTGTTEITRSSNALGSDLGQASASAGAARSGNEVDNGDGTSTITLAREMAFNIGQVTGTISEIGVFAGSTMIAGQLIKDEFGDPTTVTILSDEQLVVTYTLEWTVPNTNSLIGSGTVTDEDSNSYNYEIWAQPYFETYASIGDTRENSRYVVQSAFDEVALLESDGSTTAHDSGDLGTGWSVSHNGSGVVTFTSQGISFNPGDFSTTDLKYIAAYTADSTSSANTLNSLPDVLSQSTAFASCAVYVVFTPALSKSSSQSLSFTIEFTVNV